MNILNDERICGMGCNRQRVLSVRKSTDFGIELNMTHDYHSSIATQKKKNSWTPRKYVERNYTVIYTILEYPGHCSIFLRLAITCNGDVNLSQDLKLTQGAGAVGGHEAN